MTWWHRKKNGDDMTDATKMTDTANMADADEAISDARRSTERVERITRTVMPSLRRLEAHRRDNHVLDAMMNTLGRQP